MSKKKAILCIVISTVLLGSSGCSYKEVEDSLRSALKGEKTNDLVSDYVNEATINNSADDKNKNVFYVGDTIKSTFDYPDESGNIVSEDEVWYTLNKVDIVKNINELGISTKEFRAAFSNEDKIADNGELESDYSFVVATVSVKNISATDVDPDSNNNMLIEWMAGPASGILDSAGPVALEAAYFSGHDEKNKKDYLKFNLEAGKEKVYAVGWVVPDEMLEEPFYYVIGAAYSAEYYQYFLLNGSEGDSQ